MGGTIIFGGDLMLTLLKNFWKEEDGLGTVEIVIITAVLVGLAILFRTTIIAFAKNILTSILGQGEQAVDPIPTIEVTPVTNP